jgi:nucleoside-triphosphatase
VDEGTPRLLLEGRPGIGKTTVARRLLTLLQEADVPVAGFTTGELRTGGRREGFVVEAVSGAREVLAHVDLPGPPRVGKYGVDLAALERVGLPALGDAGPGGVVVVDELGKMELASAAFRAAVVDLLGRDVAVVATVHQTRDRFTDGLRRRPDIRVIRITEALPETAHNFRLDLIVPVRRSSAAAAPDGPRDPLGVPGCGQGRHHSPPLAARTRQDRTLQP